VGNSKRVVVIPPTHKLINIDVSMSQLTLTSAERRSLEHMATGSTAPPRQSLRARIVLQCATGAPNRDVASRLGVSAPTVALWRDRYAQSGINGLRDRPRPGRPTRVPRRNATRQPPAGAGSEPTLEHLYEAASRTISRRGFGSTRVADIAREAGVSAATIHYYFKTKEEILVRTLLWANERLVSRLAHAIDASDDPTARLAKFIERTIPYPGTQRDEYLLEIDLWSNVRLHREILPAWEDFAERWIAHLTEILADGIAAGSFHPKVSAGEVAERLVAMTDGLSAQSSIGSARMRPRRARELLLRFAAEQLNVPLDMLERKAHLPRQPA
jgi:AcrR family transcriptional regulator/DNA-binding CsgD family transcriptional regulator